MTGAKSYDIIKLGERMRSVIVKTDSVKFYNAAANIIGDNTPLCVDCGKLCNNACCEVTDEITGMYLFPEEKKRWMIVPSWAKIYDTDFEYSDECFAKLFTCKGKCVRKMRPLACMIFPLVPYAHRGEKLQIIMDPRGRSMCPLVQAVKIEELDPEFVKAVTRAMNMLMKVRECREFIYSLSKQLDEFLSV